MDIIREYAVFIVPFIIVEFILMITVHVLKHSSYKCGNRVIWIIVVVLLQIFGPVVYFVFGRSDE